MTARRTRVTDEGSPRRVGRKSLTTSLVLSIVAIAISALSFGMPIVEREVSQHRKAEAYLAHIASSQATYGQYFAEEDSPAADFARYVRLVHYAAQGDSDGGPGEAFTEFGPPFEGPRFDLCFPELAVLPLGCGVARDFQFSPSGKVTDFVWADLPISAYMDLTPKPVEVKYPSVTVQVIGAVRKLGALRPPGQEPTEENEDGDGVVIMRLIFNDNDVKTVDLVSVNLLDASGEPSTTAWRFSGGSAGYLVASGQPWAASSVAVCFNITTEQGDIEPGCVDPPAYW